MKRNCTSTLSTPWRMKRVHPGLLAAGIPLFRTDFVYHIGRKMIHPRNSLPCSSSGRGGDVQQPLHFTGTCTCLLVLSLSLPVPHTHARTHACTHTHTRTHYTYTRAPVSFAAETARSVSSRARSQAPRAGEWSRQGQSWSGLHGDCKGSGQVRCTGWERREG